MLFVDEFSLNHPENTPIKTILSAFASKYPAKLVSLLDRDEFCPLELVIYHFLPTLLPTNRQK